MKHSMKTLAFPLFVLLVLAVLLPGQSQAASVVEPGPKLNPPFEMPLTDLEQTQEMGRICLAPLVHPGVFAPGEVGDGFNEDSAEAEDGAPSENADLDTREAMEEGVELPPEIVTKPISLEADKNGRISAEADRAVSLGPLSLDEEHLVKVREDDKIVQAFLVSFAGRNPGELCVFYHKTKQTWVVAPMDEVATWCTCDHGAYVPPPSEEELLELENQTDETERSPADPTGETGR